jgi:hypothetical protein
MVNGGIYPAVVLSAKGVEYFPIEEEMMSRGTVHYIA